MSHRGLPSTILLVFLPTGKNGIQQRPSHLLVVCQQESAKEKFPASAGWQNGTIKQERRESQTSRCQGFKRAPGSINACKPFCAACPAINFFAKMGYALWLLKIFSSRFLCVRGPATRRRPRPDLVAAFPRDTVLLNPKLELLGVRLSLSGVRFSMSVFETQSASIPLPRRLNGVPDLACPVPGFRCLELPLRVPGPAAKAALCFRACPPKRIRETSAPGPRLPGPWTRPLSRAPFVQRLRPKPRTKPLAKASHKGLGKLDSELVRLYKPTYSRGTSWTANLCVCTSWAATCTNVHVCTHLDKLGLVNLAKRLGQIYKSKFVDL